MGGFACSDVSADTRASFAVALGDVDGDGMLDAVFANFSVDINHADSLCLGDGMGGFACSNVNADTNRSFGVALSECADGSTPPCGVATPTPEQQLEANIDTLLDIVDANPGTPLADKLEDALAQVQTALDELAKEPPDNQAALGNIEGAVGDIEAAVNDGLLDATEGTDLMDQLAGAARQLAEEALNEAIAQGGDPGVIADAQQALDDGDTLRASGAFKDAVNKYKDALAKAES